MKNKGKQISNTNGEASFFKYLKGNLSAHERHSFERSIMSDPFEADAYDGLSHLSSAELQHDLETLNNRLFRKKNSLWITIASAASVILVIGFVSVVLIMRPFQNKDKIAVLKPFVNDTTVIKKQYTPPTDVKKIESLSVKNNITEQPNPIDKPLIATITESLSEENIESTNTIPVIDNIENDEESLFTEIEITDSTHEPRIIKSKETLLPSPIMIRGVSSFSATKDSLRNTALQGVVNGINIGQEPEPVLVKGYVVDDMGEPVPGVTITQNNSDRGVISDLNGYFELSIPGDETNRMLAANYIGYDTYKFKVQDDTTRITLNPNLLALEEVVVVGYGSQKEEQATETYTPAKPAMGISNFRKRVIEKLKALDMHIEGEYKIVVNITVSSTGLIDFVEVISTPYKPLNDELVKIIKETSDWEPASKNNNPISERQRITFRVKP